MQVRVRGKRSGDSAASAVNRTTERDSRTSAQRVGSKTKGEKSKLGYGKACWKVNLRLHHFCTLARPCKVHSSFLGRAPQSIGLYLHGPNRADHFVTIPSGIQFLSNIQTSTNSTSPHPSSPRHSSVKLCKKLLRSPPLIVLNLGTLHISPNPKPLSHAILYAHELDSAEESRT